MKTANEQRMRNIQAIAMNITNVFNEDNEMGMYIDLNETDPTELITDMIKALNIAYQQLTSDYKDNLEFTYLCNQLIFQDALEKNSKLLEEEE